MKGPPTDIRTEKEEQTTPESPGDQSAPLKDFVQIRQVSELQDVPIFCEVFRRQQVGAEGFIEDVLHSPLPGVCRGAGHFTLEETRLSPRPRVRRAWRVVGAYSGAVRPHAGQVSFPGQPRRDPAA